MVVVAAAAVAQELAFVAAVVWMPTNEIMAEVAEAEALKEIVLRRFVHWHLYVILSIFLLLPRCQPIVACQLNHFVALSL